MEDLKIPNEWHKKLHFNCLTNEQWTAFIKQYEIGDDFPVDCDGCGKFVIEDYHRCSCGNRRCVIYCDTDKDNNYIFYADVW